MVVVDHQPHAWFLLQDAQGLVLESYSSFSVVLRLNDEESELVAAQGRRAIVDLARSIQLSPSSFANRAGGRPLDEATLSTIMRWQASQSVA
jgi:hypothetical protein